MQRRERPVQHVVHALVAAAPFYRLDAGRLFDHTDQSMIPRRTGTIGAGIYIGDVIANRAQPQAGLQPAHRVCQRRRVLVRRAQDMKGKALRALGAHARQFLQLFNQPRHRLGITGHEVRLLANELIRGLCVPTLAGKEGCQGWGARTRPYAYPCVK